jgi:hypothetical protein
MGRGRPSKLEPQRQALLLDVLRAGLRLRVACGQAGIHYATLRRWLVKGEPARNGKVREFREAVRDARLQAEATITARWAAQTATDWRAAQAFFLRLESRTGSCTCSLNQHPGPARDGRLPGLPREISLVLVRQVRAG